MKVILRFVHKISPRFDDVDGPFEATEADFSSLERARKWFARHRIKLGKVRWRHEGRKVVFFPQSRMSSSPHAIVVEPGSQKRLKGREIGEMASRLKQKGYSKPGMYARKLYREGIRLKARWMEEPGPEGHLQQGGRARTGRRHVEGVEERLWSPRGGPGSLEVTHGFRDPHRARRSPSRSKSRPDAFTQAYIEAALWSSTDESDESGGEPLDYNYGPSDIAPETLREMMKDCALFQRAARKALASADEKGVRTKKYSTDERAGHDFWLNRNGHGAGFWDGDWPEPEATFLDELSEKFGEYNLYVGDDGQIWGSGSHRPLDAKLRREEKQGKRDPRRGRRVRRRVRRVRRVKRRR